MRNLNTNSFGSAAKCQLPTDTVKLTPSLAHPSRRVTDAVTTTGTHIGTARTAPDCATAALFHDTIFYRKQPLLSQREFYSAVNTLRLSYKNQPFNAV